jgi:hypothetical protein
VCLSQLSVTASPVGATLLQEPMESTLGICSLVPRESPEKNFAFNSLLFWTYGPSSMVRVPLPGGRTTLLLSLPDRGHSPGCEAHDIQPSPFSLPK